jgi:hypothetical protein
MPFPSQPPPPVHVVEIGPCGDWTLGIRIYCGHRKVRKILKMNEIWQLNQVNLSSVDKSNSVENK